MTATKLSHKLGAMVKKLLPVATLHQLLIYDREAGKLFWHRRAVDFFTDGYRTAQAQCNMWNGRHAGKAAFTTRKDGYLCGCILDEQYYTHRAIWAMETGAWPANQIDHKDTNRGNNRWVNLREATYVQNGRNRGGNKNTSSQYCGVSWNRQVKKWMAQIFRSGKNFYLGSFTSERKAAFAYDIAARELHGTFARLNFPEELV